MFSVHTASFKQPDTLNEIKLQQKFTIVFLAATIALVGGARILAFLPMPSKSHQAVYRPVVMALAERGHHVTFYSPFTVSDPPKTLRTVLISPQHLTPKDQNKSSPMAKQSQPPVNRLTSPLTLLFIGHSVTESIMKTEVVQNLMKSDEEYDIVITAAGYGQQCTSALSHKFDAPMVQIIPVGDVSFLLEEAGAPDNPAYMVNTHSAFSDRMTFVQRLQNTVDWLIQRAVSYYLTMTKQQATMDKYLRYPGWEARPSAMEMTSDTALVLLNSHHSIGYSYPKPPHFKEIGGVNVVQNKSLPPDIKHFLDSASDGAIYFSLGSAVSVSDVTGDEIRKAFANVFGKMKLAVLWKWEADEFPNKPANVMTSKWFPQQDILAHENVKVFITQGGMMSIYEAVSRGVPLFGIPLFGDQSKNLEHATTNGYGIRVDHSNLTEQSIEWVLQELIDDPKYKLEAERRAKLFHDRQMKPIDEAVYWIEYTLRHGRVLQPASINLPLYQLYLLDVFTSLTVLLVLAVLLLKQLALCFRAR